MALVGRSGARGPRSPSSRPGCPPGEGCCADRPPGGDDRVKVRKRAPVGPR